jgi:dTDP-4-dehydrorhamnose 3,5-epimerase
VFADDRGFFLETHNERDFAAAGIAARFVQDNQSRSKRGVLRGLHYQLEHPQGKLVRVTRGKIFDVVADVRTGSPDFGKWVGVVLDDEQKQALWIPEGFAHGFCVLSDEADVAYKTTDFYDPAAERGIRWDDPLLGIGWPIKEPILSAKDLDYPLLSPTSRDLPKYSVK